MRLVDVDPLAVLPVTAAAASAAFARASDPARDDDERREHLPLLQVTLGAVRKLLDSGEQETARLAGQLDRPIAGAPCCGTPVGDRRGLPERLDASPGVNHRCCCRPPVALPMGSVSCPDPVAVMLRDFTGAEQALCLSHAAVAVRQVHRLAVFAASRHSRAVLAEVAAGSCVISRRGRRLADAAGAAP